MRRHFSRRRRSGGDDGRSRIDVASAIAKILEHQLVDTSELEAFEREDVPDSYAALARGTGSDGTSLVVAYAPLGSDALLGALAAALSTEGEDGAPFAGEAVAIAPSWTVASLQRLGRIGTLPFRLRAITAPMLADGKGEIQPESWAPPIPLNKDRVAAGLASNEDRILFARAASALEGLASKHGGSLRGTATTLELVVLARRVAELRAEDGAVLETLEPQRSTARLSNDDLPSAFDRLEGQLRKRLNDRRVREGEHGLRARCVPLLTQALGLRAAKSWPIAGSDREVVDLIGIDGQGYPVAAAVREELDLGAIGELLDLGLALQPVLALLLADAEPPLQLAAPRLVVAAQRFTPAAAKVLAALSLGHSLYEIRGGSRGLELSEISSSAAIERAVKPRSRRGSRGRSSGPREDRARPKSDSREAPEAVDGEATAASGDAPSGELGTGDDDRPSRRRGRRRGRRRRGTREESDPADGGEEDEGDAAPEPRHTRPLEVSLFDLDDDSRDDPGEVESEGRSARRRPRRRGGRRRESGDRGDAGRAEGKQEPADPEPATANEEEDDDLELAITPLSDDAPDFEAPVPGYDEEEDLGEDVSEETKRVLEREKRRRARRSPAVPTAEPPRPPPRKRVAILACADRDSLLSAILLARELRLVEGLWVYPQEELMTFFRGVVTDLRDDTPLHVVGFTPSPAGEVLRTVPLYANRLHWYDHHEWAPEDLGAVRGVLADEALHLTPAAGSSLPAVLSTSTRRSRFSDKLVDLSAGRFSHHDYERWGRLWWHRLGEIASRRGDQRREVEALLAGRPSDLAAEAAGVPVPPIPEEVTWVSRRDFRVVHFAGYTLIVLEVDEGLDLHLASRVARERFSAAFSLTRRKGSELFVLGAEEMSGKRSFDLGGMLEHLGSKLGYVTVLADEDHISRIRVSDIDAHPERLDEIVSEIAMGRSTLDA